MLPSDLLVLTELLRRIAETLDRIEQRLEHRTRGGSYVMADGTVLTPQDIQRLADEAERGYDPEHLGPPRRSAETERHMQQWLAGAETHVGEDDENED